MKSPGYFVPGTQYDSRDECCCVAKLVAAVAYQVIHEPGIGQFREFESPQVHTRIHSSGLFLCPNWLAESARA